MKYLEVFITALKLGMTSFGGPIAHLSYFHDEYVKKKQWLSDHVYADLVALCQFLPGPASSQVGMAIGFSRAGVLGAILSWIGFTLPSALILVLFALGLAQVEVAAHQSWLHALKVVAVAVVAQAVIGMGKKLSPDKSRASIAVLACAIVVLANSAKVQILVLLVSGIIGLLFLKPSEELPHEPLHSGRKTIGAIFLSLFFLFLLALPVLRTIYPELKNVALFDSFYRAGALVFGGGHVVLPLLQVEVVPNGWVSNDLFMAGYGISNAIPGPLFAFSAYLGAVANGWAGAALCLAAAFLPSFLLVVGVLPFWEKLRRIESMRRAMLGLNAGVVGILLAALYHPVWTGAITSGKDLAVAAFGFVLLEFWKLSSWAVVLLTAAISFLIF